MRLAFSLLVVSALAGCNHSALTGASQPDAGDSQPDLNGLPDSGGLPGVCNADHADCNKMPADGCEVMISSDVKNCGSCGSACPVNANVQNAICQNGSCGNGPCVAGFLDCDGNLANGCEVNALADVANCGACGAACMLPNAMPGCAAGRCIVKACAMNFGDCDMNPMNGCEANLLTDAKNCGGCGTACGPCNPNAETACVNGAYCLDCECLRGFGDCNLNPNDGCEANLKSDDNNCGACGRVCMDGKMCLLGACS